eukprot:4366692-Pyramimonas_sp.AAC.1
MHAPKCRGGARRVEHELDWHGRGAQEAEWRNKTFAIMTARLIDQTDLHNTHRKHTSDVHFSVHTRLDKGARTYVLSPQKDPEWDRVARRVTMNFDDKTIMQYINTQDQPIGCNYNAPFSNGVANIH